MNKDSWTCDKCGSDDVMQEHATLLPMNNDNGWEEGIANSYPNEFFWCNECDEDCSPIRADINSLTSFYSEE